MVKFQLINSKNYFQTKEYRIAAAGLMLLSLFLVGPRGRESGFLEDFNLYDEFGTPITLLLIGSGIFLVWSYWYSRKAKKLGYLKFDGDSLKVEKIGCVTVIPFSELRDLRIVHNSFVGEDYEKSILNNYTGNNWMDFSYNGKHFKYEFQIDRPFKSEQLKQMVQTLKSRDVAIDYIQK